jgi:SAM-dependent methyltransferase
LTDIEHVLRGWGDAGEGPANAAAGRRLLEAVAAALSRRVRAGRVCDLGCGNGFLCELLADRGFEVVGVDASESLLQTARARNGSRQVAYQRLLFGEGSSAAITGAGSFDAAVSVDVVEHLYRPSALVDAAFDILRPGGVFVLCTPYHGYLKNVAISVLDKWDQHHHVHFDGGHIKFFSVRTLRGAVARRFIVEDFEYHGRCPGFWKNMICVARKPGP